MNRKRILPVFVLFFKIEHLIFVPDKEEGREGVMGGRQDLSQG